MSLDLDLDLYHPVRINNFNTSGEEGQLESNGSQDIEVETGDSSKAGSESPDTSEEEEDSEFSNKPSTESDNLKTSRESLSSSDEITLRSKRQKEKMRRKRRRKEVLSRERAREVLVKRENELREAKLKVSVRPFPLSLTVR